MHKRAENALVEGGKTSHGADRCLNASSENRLKRSVKFYLILIPIAVFCVSLSFGLLHHFYRFVWAGDIFYGSAIVFVAVIFLELLLIIITK